MSFLSGSKTKTTSQNQQVGVSGSGVGISGSTLAGANSQVGSINFITSDAETVQAALTTTGKTAEASIQGANQNALAALTTLERQTDRQAKIIEMAVGAAQETALNATPQSEGTIAEKFQSNQTKLLLGAVGLIVIGGTIYAFRKSH